MNKLCMLILLLFNISTCFGAKGGAARGTVYRNHGRQSQGSNVAYWEQFSEGETEYDETGRKKSKKPPCNDICMARKFSKQKPIEEKKPCVGRCYIMKRDKMKEDNHLNKMIEDWKKKRSCVGVCYLVKVKMMKDKKFRREAETWDQASEENKSGEEETIDYKEEDFKEEISTTRSSTAKPMFSQLLWNSYIKKTQKNAMKVEQKLVN